ncbi:hypothetical protein M2459_001711 [Parabacteroides sp. PF5-5]|nr:hypothetical protein [Parabacteroides sp. PH5-39]MDH6327163.1 hypothetical protein [Parabacteroides sp. PH5-41]MDH6334965.1 hypothetical protein [Parabacteroides sp. PF5-5]MDH6346029.1 hypothetical protein [Parabacteroides sp. PH5-46]MDH6384474.1 hypothetical protein [Parabacteroides sp. PH5-17]MDH6393829.1 hypothetical protein [Parabacteroides sp. PFB2-22]MDH6406940.1 hypothetical protein [Parabacteroides sp. PH5-26]
MFISILTKNKEAAPFPRQLLIYKIEYILYLAAVAKDFLAIFLFCISYAIGVAINNVE